MTENRFDYTHYDDGTESIYDRERDEYYFDGDLDEIEEVLNELNDENKQLKDEIYDWKASAEDYLQLGKVLQKENKELKAELQRIYDVSTVNKVKSIVDEIYDDLLYETSEESDYARKMVLKCLEKIDNFGDDLDD